MDIYDLQIKVHIKWFNMSISDNENGKKLSFLAKIMNDLQEK